MVDFLSCLLIGKDSSFFLCVIRKKLIYSIFMCHFCINNPIYSIKIEAIMAEYS